MQLVNKSRTWIVYLDPSHKVKPQRYARPFSTASSEGTMTSGTISGLGGAMLRRRLLNAGPPGAQSALLLNCLPL
jgi:hypothetical protein